MSMTVESNFVGPSSEAERSTGKKYRISREQEQRNGKSSYVKVFPENIQAQGVVRVYSFMHASNLIMPPSIMLTRHAWTDCLEL
jgi:hypothetical protein